MTAFDKTYHVIKKPQVIVAVTFLVILAYFFVDRSLAICMHNLDLGTHFKLLYVVTALGKWAPYVVLFLSGGFYFRYVRVRVVYEKRSWFLLGCVFIPSLLLVILKVIFSRARPELLFTSNEFGFYWFKLNDAYWSFPSGHAVTAAALFMGLWKLLPRYFLVYLLLAILICVTRLVLYKHYLSDVLFGFYMSMLVSGCFIDYYSKK